MEKRLFNEDEIIQIIKDAMLCFGDAFDFDISLENTKIAFFVPETGRYMRLSVIPILKNGTDMNNLTMSILTHLLHKHLYKKSFTG